MFWFRIKDVGLTTGVSNGGKYFILLIKKYLKARNVNR